MRTAENQEGDKFQSTPPSLAETKHINDIDSQLKISIHSAIASGDRDVAVRAACVICISIHSAIASGDSKLAHITPYNQQ